MSDDKWRVRFHKQSRSWEGDLTAYWEVHLDPISDEFTPSQVPAAALLGLWAERVRRAYPNGLIPIYWFVQSESEGKFVAMPFAYDHFNGESEVETFLDVYDWPEHADTGELLNWLLLPVADKLWRDSRADKGGFIQEATGWKPSILQPFVFLPSLLKGQHS